ncbi:hypothetical protein ABZX51_009515 [Aspergillus tubingensis]
MPAARVCGATERVDLINLLWLTCIMISIYCVLLFNVATVSSPPPRADHLNFYYSGASPEFPPPRFIFQWVGMEPIARRLLPPSLCSIQLGPHTPRSTMDPVRGLLGQHRSEKARLPVHNPSIRGYWKFTTPPHDVILFPADSAAIRAIGGQNRR